MQRTPHREIPWSTLALLAALALLLTIWQHRAEHRERTSLPEAIVVALGRPLQTAFTRLAAWPRDLTVGLVQARRLVAENASLRRQLDEKQAQVTEYIGYYLENKAMREALGLSPQRSPKRIPAQVTGLEIRPHRCRATVRLQQPGVIAEGDVVVQDRGLVGRVIKVSGKTAEIMLLIDSLAAVAGRDMRSRDEDQAMGMIYPQTSFATPPMQLKMEKLRPVADLREGDVIVSSGLDDVYPPNVPIGTIEQVLRSPASAESVTAVVRPFVDFYRLEFVYIVKQK
jgi:rod shape-determining protein MreC